MNDLERGSRFRAPRLRDHDIRGYLADPDALYEFTRGRLLHPQQPSENRNEHSPKTQRKKGTPLPLGFNPSGLPDEVVDDMKRELRQPGDSRIALLVEHGTLKIRDRTQPTSNSSKQKFRR